MFPTIWTPAFLVNFLYFKPELVYLAILAPILSFFSLGVLNRLINRCPNCGCQSPTNRGMIYRAQTCRDCNAVLVK